MAPVLVKSLSRLNTSSLIDLALKWLRQQDSCEPYLSTNRSFSEADEEDYLFTPAEDVDSLREIYRLLREDEKEISRRNIIDRIVDGDWRRGLSLHQLAMIDFAYLEQHDTALKWTALELVPLDNEEDPETEPPSKKRRKLSHTTSTPKYPHIAPATFVNSLKSEISPLVKAHYHLHRLPPPSNLSILRLHISPNTPFAPSRSSIPKNAKQACDGGRVMYIALPGSCPYVYIALSGSTGPSTSAKRDAKGRIPAKVDMAAMKRVVLEAIPKAMSRPQERWALRSAKLTTKSLHSICELRGNSKPGSGGGAYGVLIADEECKLDSSPVDVQQQKIQIQKEERQIQVETRFGTMKSPHYAALDRVFVKIEDLARPQDEARRSEDAAPVTLNFSGTDVFHGLRQLAELGDDYIDLSKMPAWMTGEMGVSSLTV